MPTKETIRTPEAPRAIGPYSQGIAAGGFLFASGQIPVDPRTGEVVEGGIEDQVKRVLENLKAVLRADGLDFDSVVKTTVYLADLADFAKMNEVYGAYFDGNPPARATVGVSGLPKGVRVEIDLVAVREK